MIKKADFNDIEKIMEIIKSIVAEMKSYGNTQWDENYPDKKSFENDVKDKTLYIDEENGEIKGFICITYKEPEEYKNINWSFRKKAVVIRRMAVNPKFRNKGTGFSLLKSAEDFAVKNKIGYLKTNTYSLNKKMISLFGKFGFEYRGEMNFHGKEKPFYCYEKIIK